MQSGIINIALAFIEGFALIISPCILPILPIMLAGSFNGSKKRPLGIVLGFVMMFAFFTFFSRSLIQYLHIDTNIIRNIAFLMLFLLGIMMLSTTLTEQFSRLTQRLGNVGSALSRHTNTQGGFLSGLWFGGLIALIWTPCAGPILAAVIVQTVLQQTNVFSLFILIAFAIGAASPMLLIIWFGRTIIDRLSFFKTHAVLFRKILGAMVVLAVGIMFYTENTITNQPPQKTAQTVIPHQLISGLLIPYDAPEIAGIKTWINSAPLNINALKGKVVLIDFWTYSCINCQRTLPFLINWYQKYHHQGFEIIGVHSPEFDFEKNINNVQKAVVADGILYPIALDNEFKTWQNFHNQYWPAHYLINQEGKVVYTHFGEGDDDVTENNIRYLLGLNTNTTSIKNEPETSLFQTPETYLGHERAESFSSPEAVAQNQSATYSFPSTLSKNAWALQGSWAIMPDRIIATKKNAAIRIHFYARKVFVVMGNRNQKAMRVRVFLDGKPITPAITVNRHDLFDITTLKKTNHGLLELQCDQAGLEIYTFTFGG